MKKTLVFLALSSMVFTVFAQDSKMAIGIEAAAVSTTLWTSPMPEHIDPLFSFSPGVNFEYLFTPQVSIKTGLIYESIGFKSEVYDSDEDGHILASRIQTVRQNYITIPILLSYTTKGNFRFYANGGTFLGFLINGNVVLSESEVRPESNHDITETLKKFNVGLSFGIGMLKSIGDKMLIDVGLRDNLGLIHVGKEEGNEVNGIRTNSLGLVLALKYRL